MFKGIVSQQPLNYEAEVGRHHYLNRQCHDIFCIFNFMNRTLLPYPLTPANSLFVRVSHGTGSSKPLEFLRYLNSFQKYSNFFLVFLTGHPYLKTYFYENYTELSYLSAKFSMKEFFFNSVPSLC